MKDIIKADLYAERERYDLRSANLLNESDQTDLPHGAKSMEMIYQKPYLIYEKYISRYILPHHSVLEIGSGSGLHTRALLETGATVTASDIAPNSLMLLEKRFRPLFGDKLKVEVADMEQLPFGDQSFDAVTCAGSLSYGDSQIVNRQINSVLKTGGIFICVDSLNHNPIYKLNRYIHYIRGNRTLSTLKRMPDMQRIESLKKMFSILDIHFFGSLTWAAPLFRPILGMKRTAKFFESFDKAIGVRRSAFKFVLVGRKYPVYGG